MRIIKPVLAGGSSSDIEISTTDEIWVKTLYDYNIDSNLIYIGKHTVSNAAESDPLWSIWCYTWVDVDLTMKQGPKVGSWDDRALLGW